jgi:hypothetical protein
MECALFRMWAAIAAANGSEEAISVRNAAEARMTRGEVEQARAKAAALGKRRQFYQLSLSDGTGPGMGK